MKMKLFLLTGLFFGSIALSSLLSQTTTAAATNTHATPLTLFAVDPISENNATQNVEQGNTTTTPVTSTTGGAATEGSSCRVEGIGWIICPLAKEMSKIVDAAYTFVSSLLVVQPLTTTGVQANTYNAWSMMRNFANIAFVIAFLLIIFSQLTSFGLNNYGIKKMLPRLIVAAILVNASYWICAIGVDISNILGASLRGLFDGMGADLPTSATGAPDPIADGTGWEGITGLVLAGTIAGGMALYVGLSALLPALLAALVAIVTVFLVLTLRQALIILLIVISPLAFVAYLLPNTESLFKKWMALFKTMLLMYPIIAMIFGASALASEIVMGTATGDYKVAVQIMGALVAIIPLALTPIVMKTAGGLLNRFGGVINNPSKGPVDRLRKGAEGIHKRQEGRRAIRELSNGKTMGFGKYKRAAGRSRMESGIESEKKRAEADFLSKETVNNASFRNKAAGGLNIGGPDASQGAMQRALNSAIDVQAQIEISEVKAADAQIEHAAIPNEMIQALALGQRTFTDSSGNTQAVTLGDSDAMRKAAIKQQVASGQADKISELVNQYGGTKGEESKTLANALQSSSGRPGWIGAGAIEAIRQGKAVGRNGLSATQTQMEGAINSGAYSADKMATADADELRMLADYVHGTNASATPAQQVARAALVQSAQTALSDPILSTKLGKRGSNVEAIAQQAAGVDPAPARTLGQAAAAPAQPTVNIPPQPTQAPTIQNQPAAPVVLNVPHNPPQNANPGNYRTTPPPNTGGYGPNSSGLYVPNNNQQPPRTPPNP
jgi:hypothetical protein